MYDATVLKNKAKRILELRAMKRGWTPPPKKHPLADHPEFSALLGLPDEPAQSKILSLKRTKPAPAATPCRLTPSSAPTAKERAARRAGARPYPESNFRTDAPKTTLSPPQPPAMEKLSKVQTRTERRKIWRLALVPAPSQEQIVAHACELARESGQTDRHKMNLLRWPSWATPPSEWEHGLDVFWAAAMKAKAKTLRACC